MNVIETKLPGVFIIEPKVFGDHRGFFYESWQKKRYEEYGISGEFVQDNVSYSRKGVLRGLHFQNPNGQGKLVSVLQGEVFDVAVDIRVGSPTFGQWTSVSLSGENHRQFWIPAGFAHGFCVTSETVLFSYKCTELYAPEYEGGIAWNDPGVGVEWPLVDVTLSAKDKVYPCLHDIKADVLPKW
ncbi:dTDP-4-dehydrorhamnose 3,5-epimerase [Anaeroarcus burkinensis]|uniref:dTDP-4-dehydrorhamnose 3,5-epimerase n=1 Tax=Anaeroarcus burkinensis TaxID=82376 RepID=UPI0003F87F42|nr:dTDP-4-dehydrorhamnose 3,5-epimerase [Anaeroarcus burkinensis]